mmetsp:Transcript_817/g.1959  ORF Transcript_817/g.1959 Transcript_817/m.1959 type:complete len:442 (+) Transcript_817:1099-2424(+)
MDREMPRSYVFGFILKAAKVFATRGEFDRMMKTMEEMMEHESALKGEPIKALLMCADRWLSREESIDESVEETDRILRMVASALPTKKRDGSVHKTIIGSFHECLYKWGETGRNDAGEKAESLLSLLEEVYNTTGIVALAPSEQTYGHVMRAWQSSREPDAAGRALKLLKKCETSQQGQRTLKPRNRELFLALSLLCASERDYLNEERDLFKRIGANYLAGDESQNLTSTSISNFLGSFQDSVTRTAGERSEQFLRRAAASSVSTPGLELLAPSSTEYGHVLEHYAAGGSFEDVERLLNEMKNSEQEPSIEPTPSTYCGLVNTLLATKDIEQLNRAQFYLENAMEVYGEMGSPLQSEICSSYLKACAELLPEGEKRDSAASKALSLAIENGLVDQDTWDTVGQLFSQVLQDRLTTEEEWTAGSGIPETWKANIDENAVDEL